MDIAAGAGLLAVFIALIEGILTTVVSWLVDASNNIVAGLFNSKFTNFGGSDGNLLKIFEDIFTTYNLKVGWNFAQLIMFMSLFLILLLTIFEVINSMTAGLQGERAENPLKILARGVITLVLELLIFGIPFNAAGGMDNIGDSYSKPIYGETTHYDKVCMLISSNGEQPSDMSNCDGNHGGSRYGFIIRENYDYKPITGYEIVNPSKDDSAYFSTGKNASLVSVFGEIMSQFLDLVFGKGVNFSASGFGKSMVSLDIAGIIVLVILQLAVFKNVIQCGIVFVERYLSFAFYILMGPLAVACNATSKTKSTYHDWLMGVLSQFITIFISIAALKMYISCWNMFINGVGNNTDKGVPIISDLGVSPEVIIHYCVCLALLALVTNSEKIVNALGFRTIMNGDTARSWGSGAIAASMVFRMTAGRAVGNLVRNGVGAYFHTGSVAMQYKFGNDAAGSKMIRAFDINKNTQMGMKGNMFHNNGFAYDHEKGLMTYKGQTTSNNARIQKALNAYNDAIQGKSDLVNMKDIAPVLGTNTVGNRDISENGVVMQDQSGHKMIVAGCRYQDKNGQIHNTKLGFSLNGDMERGEKLTASNDLDYGVKSYQINSIFANTGTDNGITIYKLDKTDTLSNTEFKNQMQEGIIDGKFDKNGDILPSDKYVDNREDYNEFMVLAQERIENLTNVSYVDAKTWKEAGDAGIQTAEKIKAMRIGKLPENSKGGSHSNDEDGLDEEAKSVSKRESE